jgi:predicted nucleic acid-binding Zn ribbon protein
MDKCVYCGSPLPEKHPEVQVKKSRFGVCSDECLQCSELYLRRDQRYKTILYLVILIAAVIIIITAVTKGDMHPVYISESVVGLAFLIFPYPISVFTTFQHTSIRKVITASRVIGVILAAAGIMLFFLL